MSYRIYLVEDEESLNEILSYYMKEEGWDVKSFTRGTDAQIMINEPPHLWILDIMLPDLDGIQLIKEIKQKTPNVPVIFMSARNSDMDRIMGLELGSDDYLSKPFLPRELIIRTQKLLNRVYGVIELQSMGAESVDGYQVDRSRRTVSDDGIVVDITSKEFDMLLLFINEKSQALSRDYILSAIWGDDAFYSDRVVDNLIKRLRKKLPNLRIETIYGFGYRRL